MRIAFDIRPLQAPGAARGIGRYVSCVLPLIRQLVQEQGGTFAVLVDACLPLPAELASITKVVVNQIRVPKRQMGWLRDELLVGRWNQLPFDVVHLTSPFDLSFGWPVLSRIPKVFTLYDLFALDIDLGGYRRLARPIYRWMAYKLRYVQALACISDYTAKEVHRFLGRDCPLTYVTPLAAYPPVTATHNLEQQTKAPAALTATAPKLRLPEEFLLLCPCWPPHKNVATVLEALVPLGALSPPLVVAGHCPPSDLSKYQQLAQGLPVFWAGSVSQDELNWLYQNCRGFVFPSLREGFGLTPLEAMAWGAPVIVSNRPPMTEVVTREDWQFDPQSPESIRAACLGLWERGRQPEDSQWAVQRAAQFNWSLVAQQTLEIYQQVHRTGMK